MVEKRVFAPGYRTIQFNVYLYTQKAWGMSFDKVFDYSVRLPLPYLLFWTDWRDEHGEVCQYPKLYVNLMKRKNGVKYFPIFPNCYGNGRVCLGDEEDSCGGDIDELINLFWNTSFSFPAGSRGASNLVMTLTNKKIKTNTTERCLAALKKWKSLTPQKMCRLPYVTAKKFNTLDNIFFNDNNDNIESELSKIISKR